MTNANYEKSHVVTWLHKEKEHCSRVMTLADAWTYAGRIGQPANVRKERISNIRVRSELLRKIEKQAAKEIRRDYS